MGGNPINCYSGNVDTSGTLTSSPANLETTNACGTGAAPTSSAADPNEQFLLQAACDTEALGPGFCPVGQPGYPRMKKVVMHQLPAPADDARPVQGRPGQRVVLGEEAQGVGPLGLGTGARDGRRYR